MNSDSDVRPPKSSEIDPPYSSFALPFIKLSKSEVNLIRINECTVSCLERRKIIITVGQLSFDAVRQNGVLPEEMREDLRFKFIRGIYERLVLSEYLYCKAYQGQILSLSNLIVQLTIRNHAVRSVGQATHLLSGVGNLAKSCLISIEEDKYLSKSPSEDDKQPSILAAALVALLENIEAYRIKPNCVTQNAGSFPSPKCLW